MGMNTPFKMSPKQEGLIKAVREKDPKAAKKIEAGIKANDKKSKDDVDGPMLMNSDYAAQMGGYKAPLMKDGRYKVSSDGKTYRDRTGEGGRGVNKRYATGTGPMAEGKK